jgi:hypothetical protein
LKIEHRNYKSFSRKQEFTTHEDTKRMRRMQDLLEKKSKGELLEKRSKEE